MRVERLWTPWRMQYIDEGNSGSRSGCVFCDALAAGDDVEKLILFRGERAFLILNLFPYNSGHVMAVPFTHAPSPEDLDPETRGELTELGILFMRAARAVLRPHGFNTGMNIGDVAGAGVAEHLHLHLVPRWKGDANFMPILAGTTVMPELLPVTYARLRAEIERLVAARDEPERLVQAGGLVVLPDTAQLVLRRTSTGAIALPKGHIEPGENVAEAAVREIREETGIHARLTGWGASIDWNLTHPDGTTQLRRIIVYTATGEPTEETAAHLEQDTLLVSLEQAAEHVSFEVLRAAIQEVMPRLQALVGKK